MRTVYAIEFKACALESAHNGGPVNCGQLRAHSGLVRRLGLKWRRFLSGSLRRRSVGCPRRDLDVRGGKARSPRGRSRELLQRCHPGCAPPAMQGRSQRIHPRRGPRARVRQYSEGQPRSFNSPREGPRPPTPTSPVYPNVYLYGNIGQASVGQDNTNRAGRDEKTRPGTPDQKVRFPLALPLEARD